MFEIKKDKHPNQNHQKLLQRIQANPQLMANHLRISSNEHQGPSIQDHMSKFGSNNNEYCKIIQNYQTDQRNKNQNLLSQSREVSTRGYFTNTHGTSSIKRSNIEP